MKRSAVLFGPSVAPPFPPDAERCALTCEESIICVSLSADDAPIVGPLDAWHIRWQMRFDPMPLLVAQPKQIPAQ
jgi:hypothetical protein